MSNKYKKAFTLAETMITIGIIGILAALLLPNIIKNSPSKEEELARKIQYLVEQVTDQLYNDDAMYPKKSDFGDQGFQNTEKVTIGGTEYQGNTKFCELFTSKFNKKATYGCTENQKTFTSADGADWYVPITDFTDGHALLKVDINGPEGVNCGWTNNACSSKNSRRQDRFEFHIKSNGTITMHDPIDTSSITYNINVNARTRNSNGTINAGSVGGSWEIKELKNNGETAELEDGQIEKGKTYIITATPNSGYYSSWPNNKKKVRIANSSVTVDLLFTEKETHCVKVAVDYPNDISTIAASFKIKKDCKFIAASAGDTGLYRKEGTDFSDYTYVGPLPAGASISNYYKYTCSSSDQVTMTVDNSANTEKVVQACGLYPGEYQINMTPPNSYRIQPGNQGNYSQNVRLGTEDLKFYVTINYNTSGS